MLKSFINLDSGFRDKNNFPNPFNYTVLENQVETWMKIGGCRNVEVVDAKIERLSIPYPRVELFATDFIEIKSVATTDFTTATAHGLSVGDILECIIQPLNSNVILKSVQYEVSNIVSATSFQLFNIGGATTLDFGTTFDFSGKNRLRFALTDSTIDTAVETAREILKTPQIFVDIHCRSYNDNDLIDTIGGKVRSSKFVIYTDSTKLQYDEYGYPIWIHYSCNMIQTIRYKKNECLNIRLCDRNGKVIDIYSELPSEANPLKQLLLTLSMSW